MVLKPHIAVIVFWFAWVSSAGAYLLQGPHVLELMVRELSTAKTLRVRQAVVIEDRAVSEQSVELFETISFIFPDRFRSDAWHEQTNRIHVVSRDKALIVIDGIITGENESRFDRYKDVLLYNVRKPLHQILAGYGVDVAQTSLGRFEDHIVYVIGAQYPDESKSQLWVDKERFIPLRWLNVESPINSFDEPDRLEFVYRNWHKKGELWYPMQIDSYRNQVLVRQIRVQDIEVDADFAPDLMDIYYLKTIYQPKTQDLHLQKPEADMDEVQQVIDEFESKIAP